ncbi:MAG: hypothetical protein LKJ44_04800 [Bifidobacteriaceae bacterium]|jgi:hypothetical protein|nr:hypothetical protein [Bifidobacteriaceae bacterium]MCI1979017.1 hypothetical protein [Bifidobacteriaceae bacterium]
MLRATTTAANPTRNQRKTRKTNDFRDPATKALSKRTEPAADALTETSSSTVLGVRALPVLAAAALPELVAATSLETAAFAARLRTTQATMPQTTQHKIPTTQLAITTRAVASITKLPVITTGLGAAGLKCGSSPVETTKEKATAHNPSHHKIFITTRDGTITTPSGVMRSTFQNVQFQADHNECIKNFYSHHFGTMPTHDNDLR